MYRNSVRSFTAKTVGCFCPFFCFLPTSPCYYWAFLLLIGSKRRGATTEPQEKGHSCKGLRSTSYLLAISALHLRCSRHSQSAPDRGASCCDLLVVVGSFEPVLVTSAHVTVPLSMELPLLMEVPLLVKSFCTRTNLSAHEFCTWTNLHTH